MMGEIGGNDFNYALVKGPSMEGSSDIDQLGKIFAAFGTPKAAQWPDMVYLPDYVEYQYVPAPPLRSLFPMASDNALDLLSKMFTYDPKVRISAQQALEHKYFTSPPVPTNPAALPRPARKGETNSKAPPRKLRRVMHNRNDGTEGSVQNADKFDHANDNRSTACASSNMNDSVPM